MICKIITSILSAVLLVTSMAAQTVSDVSKNVSAVSPETKEKAWKLVSEMARESGQFSLASNRVNARYIVANLLWEKDEKAARALFQSAISELNGLTGQIPPEDAEAGEESNTERYMMIYYIGSLRKEFLMTLAAHDPKLALDTLQLSGAKNADGKSVFEGDENLELELAAKIVENDPQQAYEIAKNSLAKGIGINVFSALESLYKKDDELGVKLAQEILKKIKERDATPAPNQSVSENSNMMTTANPVSVGTVNVWEMQSFLDTVKKLNSQAVRSKKKPVLSDSEFKETIGIIAQTFVNQQYLSGYEVSKLMPEISKYFPSMALAIRRKISREETVSFNKLIKNQEFLNKTEDKSPEEVLQFIETMPVAERDDYYYQAAETAFYAGEIEKAKTFHAKLKTKREYDYLEKGISEAMPLMLAAKGDLSQVRQYLSQLKTPEKRIEVLTALAESVGKAGDLKTASALMNEASSVYQGRMKNRRNMTSIFQLSKAYASIEPNQGFGILESNTQFFNEIISAAILLDEFNENGSVENDELRLDAVRRESYQSLPNGVEIIKNFASADFERTVNLADKFSRPEVRFFARFRIADALLDPKAEQSEKDIQKTYNEQEYDH